MHKPRPVYFNRMFWWKQLVLSDYQTGPILVLNMTVNEINTFYFN